MPGTCENCMNQNTNQSNKDAEEVENEGEWVLVFQEGKERKEK